MQRTAVVKQAPLASSLRGTRSVLDDIGRTVDDGHARAVQFLRHTDRAGTTFLLRAGNRIRTFPMRTFLAIEDRVAMWRTLSRARAQNPDVGIAEVGTAMRRYGDLPRGAPREAFRSWWARGGPEAVEASARLSDDAITTLSNGIRVAADGGVDLETRYMTALSRADDSLGATDDVIETVGNLGGRGEAAAKRFIVAGNDDAIRAVRQIEESSNAELASFVQTVDGLQPRGEAQIARMIAQADDGAELAAILRFGHYQRIVAQDAGEVATRLSNRGVDASGIAGLIDESIPLRRADDLLSSSYRRWSTEGTGFDVHYADHADDWSPRLTRDEYRATARELMNRERAGLEVYLQQVDNGETNLLVYDPETGALATGGHPGGRIQTLFKPDEPAPYLEGLDLIQLQ